MRCWKNDSFLVQDQTTSLSFHNSAGWAQPRQARLGSLSSPAPPSPRPTHPRPAPSPRPTRPPARPLPALPTPAPPSPRPTNPHPAPSPRATRPPAHAIGQTGKRTRSAFVLTVQREERHKGPVQIPHVQAPKKPPTNPSQHNQLSKRARGVRKR